MKPDDLREHVARAMYERKRVTHSARQHPAVPWDKALEPNKNFYRYMADAAIEALQADSQQREQQL